MCSTNLFIFLATNEHKFLLNSIRIVFAPHGISVHWCNSWLKKIIVSGFPKYCLWITEGRVSQLLYYCLNLFVNSCHDFSRSAVVAKLTEVDALPSAEVEAPFGDGNRETYTEE